MPFYGVRQELYAVDDLIFRMDRNVIPTSLQRRVIKAAHHVGHMGMTKTKQMLREKYIVLLANHEQYIRTGHQQVLWLPGDYKTAPKRTDQEHKETKKPWDIVAVDYTGPYPDGHYNLLARDKRTRYPEVGSTHQQPSDQPRTGWKPCLLPMAPYNS